MAKWVFKGLDDYISGLQKIEDLSLGGVVYQGAKIVADNVKANLEQLPVDSRRRVNVGKRSGLLPEQKEGLINGFGVSKMRNDKGYINVKLGFDGYNSVKTEAYPNGQPNLMIARALTSGTSFMDKNDVIQRSVSEVKKKCEETMREYYDNMVEKKIGD